MVRQTQAPTAQVMCKKKRKLPQNTIKPHPKTLKNGFPNPKMGGGVLNPPKT